MRFRGNLFLCRRPLRWSGDALKVAVCLIVAIGCVQEARAQRIRVVSDAHSSKILSIRKAANLPKGDLADKIEKDAGGRPILAESRDKVRQAFVLCVPSGSKEVTSCVNRVFVTDLGADVTHEITGEELFIEANRPVDKLKWVTNYTFSFERWTGPHFGHRYIIDIKKMKQTGAFILTDQ